MKNNMFAPKSPERDLIEVRTFEQTNAELRIPNSYFTIRLFFILNSLVPLCAGWGALDHMPISGKSIPK